MVGVLLETPCTQISTIDYTMNDTEEDKKPAAKMTTEDDNGDTSDVEIEGLDLDDDKEAGDDEGDDDDDDDDDDEMANAEAVPESPTKEAPIDEELQHHLEEEEAQEMEEARKERMELMKTTVAEDAPATAADKLNFLLGQSEVFAHFMAGSVAATENKNKRNKKGNGAGKSSRGRMSEAEEDAQLLKSAASKRRGVVRLEKQPTLLAEHCKMHKYQIEGLNFLIQLHDHGIHGILADEMGLGKTLQTISLLAYLREARGMKGEKDLPIHFRPVSDYYSFKNANYFLFFFFLVKQVLTSWLSPSPLWVSNWRSMSTCGNECFQH